MKLPLLFVIFFGCGVCFGAEPGEAMDIEKFILGSWRQSEEVEKGTISISWIEFRAGGSVYLDHRRGLAEGTWKNVEGSDEQVVVIFANWKVIVFRRGGDLIFRDSNGEKIYVRYPIRRRPEKADSGDRS